MYLCRQTHLKQTDMQRILTILFFVGALLTTTSAQTTHTIQRGETLETIAKLYGITVEELKAANPKLHFVYEGKELQLPQKGENSISTDAQAMDGQMAEGDVPANAYQTSGFGEKEQYRRSSLCMILLTHRDKKYAEDMERVFKSFPLPKRYNEHNISDLRVISVKGKQSQADIDKLVKNNYVAQKVVGRWFNRSEATGQMNMDLIHDRGGYGASYADYKRAMSNIRGTAMLRDEGIELLQSTFVLVCDMDYIDKKKGFQWGALALAVLSAGAEVASTVQESKAEAAYRRGDYDEARDKQKRANAYHAGSTVGNVAAAVVGDIGGFRVKMHAYLYKLQWNDSMTEMMYNDFWADSSTPENECEARKVKFESAQNRFQLEFVGKYEESSSKTILTSWNNEDEVILDVCERCVEKGMRELAKAFPVFRPRAPFYFDGEEIYSHMGQKEDVETDKKYEILQPYKDKHGQIAYKRVGTAKAGTPWNNRDIDFSHYFNRTDKGTRFFCNSSVDLHTPGLQLREM